MLSLWDLLPHRVRQALGLVAPAPSGKAAAKKRLKPAKRPEPVSKKPVLAEKKPARAKRKPVAVALSASKEAAPASAASTTLPDAQTAGAAAPSPRVAAYPGLVILRTASREKQYQAVMDWMLSTHTIRVRKWRKVMSGVAWEVRYRDGRVQRLLESPKPKTPISMSIFLHEVGHHAIGLGVYRPRCLEEYKAWRFAVDTMADLGLEVDEKVTTRMFRSMEYAVAKSTRRGIKSIPTEVTDNLTQERARIAGTAAGAGGHPKKESGQRPGRDSNARPAA